MLWEYCAYEARAKPAVAITRPDIDEALRKHGAMGWELASIVPIVGAHLFLAELIHVFKRPVAQPGGGVDAPGGAV